MKKNKSTTMQYQQLQWVEQAYADIKEDPLSSGIGDINSEMDQVAFLIKEDVEVQFGAKYSFSSFLELIKSLNK